MIFISERRKYLYFLIFFIDLLFRSYVRMEIDIQRHNIFSVYIDCVFF